MNLYDETIKLLNQTDLTHEQIAAHLNVSSRWVSRLKRGDYKDPGVNKIQNLYWHLLDEEMKKSSRKSAA